MDKRNKRNEASDKKDNKSKDRGDLKKHSDKIFKKNEGNMEVGIKVAHPESGDSERKITTNQKPEKIRLNIVVKKPTNEETKSKNVNDGAADKELVHKKNYYKDGQEKVHEYELRKRIRDKYTLKLKSFVNKSDQSNTIQNKKDDGDGGKVAAVKSDGNKPTDRPKKQLTEQITQTKEKLNHSSTSSTNTDLNPEKKSDRHSAKEDKIAKPERAAAKPEKYSSRRKPIIKTIMSKNGPVRIYKAVTFVDQRKSPTPLEINIPASDAIKKQKVSKFTDTSSLNIKTKPIVSKTSIKQKPATVRKKNERRRDRKIKHPPSPDSMRGNLSPPTEVARWAPCSIDPQTKPYYEAWVNTTLAAISKSSKKDKLFYEKQRESILRSFKRALEERPRSPELFYENFADERYMGRIKITQR